MYDITIIGGSLSGLISAINLSDDYSICIIDINQEIGFPTNFPGFSNNIDLVKNILSKEDQSNLYLQENNIGWGMRSEWLIKYLTQLSAKKGVDIINRTRVTNIFFEDNFNIEIIGGGPQNNIINSKIIIDETKQIHSGPGEKNHTILIENDRLINIESELCGYFSGIIPTKNSPKLDNTLFQINREDGLTEFWFNSKPEDHIDWIEIKSCNSPTISGPMVIDDYFTRADEIAKQSRKLLT